MSGTATAPVVEVLERAMELYAANPSHAPRPGMPADGEYCVVTAVFSAARENDASALAVLDALDEVLGTRLDLVDWNAENTTETVLAGFKKAIALARQGAVA